MVNKFYLNKAVEKQVGFTHLFIGKKVGLTHLFIGREKSHQTESRNNIHFLCSILKLYLKEDDSGHKEQIMQIYIRKEQKEFMIAIPSKVELKAETLRKQEAPSYL